MGEDKAVLELEVSPKTIEYWNQLSPDEKRLYTRYFEALIAYTILLRKTLSEASRQLAGNEQEDGVDESG